jgi:hypothetical protein
VADLLQFLVSTPVTPRAKFYSGGVPTDLDGPAGGACTVTLTKPDGTPGPASGTVTHVSTGIYSFVLDGPADPTVYDIAWSGLIGSRPVVQTTQAEALGELLFTLPALRAFKIGGDAKFASDTTWPDEQLMDARTVVLGELTKILGFSPVPRFRRKILNGDGSTCLNLPDLFAHRVLSVTVNGAVQTATDYQINGAAQIEAISGYSYGTPFTRGRRNVAIEYVHGWQQIEGKGRGAAMVMAAAELDPSGFSNAVSVTTPDGMSYSYEPSETGRGGYQRHTGIRDLDRWLNRHSQIGLAVA